LRTGKCPLIVGGDHAIAMGTIGGAARVATRLGLIWVDAHADYNDSASSPSGNIHGMPLAAALGQADAILNDIAAVNPKVRAEDTVLIGVRDVDPGETVRLRASGITVFTSWDVETRGINAIAAEALDITTVNTDALHLSFDLDVLDPLEMPGTGTTSPGGMSYREGCVLVQTLYASGKVTSLEFTELNPLLDDAGRSCRLARDLITYALGRQLY
ncbi:MAG: arginase, partial [bacterium]